MLHFYCVKWTCRCRKQSVHLSKFYNRLSHTSVHSPLFTSTYPAHAPSRVRIKKSSMLKQLYSTGTKLVLHKTANNIEESEGWWGREHHARNNGKKKGEKKRGRAYTTI
jgi:hypothetical protein